MLCVFSSWPKRLWERVFFCVPGFGRMTPGDVNFCDCRGRF